MNIIRFKTGDLLCSFSSTQVGRQFVPGLSRPCFALVLYVSTSKKDIEYVKRKQNVVSADTRFQGRVLYRMILLRVYRDAMHVSDAMYDEYNFIGWDIVGSLS